MGATFLPGIHVEIGLNGITPLSDGTLAMQPNPGFTAVQASATSAAGLTAAAAAHTLGVSYSGSGFLLMYYVGVSAVLKSLGIINEHTQLAGSSGGAVAAALSCANTPWQQWYATNQALATACRFTSNCKGSLGAVVRLGMPTLLPAGTAEACSGRLYIAVTQAKDEQQADTGLLLGPAWGSSQQLADALGTSSYIPFFSAPSGVTNALSGYGIPAAYDGVGSDPLPAPPGATVVVTVSALAPTPQHPRPDFSGLLARLAATASTNGADAAYLPLNPTVVRQPPNRADIYPGLSGALDIEPDTWNSYIIRAPDANMMQAIFSTGRRDAAAWAHATGLASADAVQAALDATVM